MKEATYAIAKGMHHVAAASFYFDLTIVEAKATGSAKDVLNGYKNKLEWIKRDLITRISTDEAKDTLRTELQDPLWLDCMADSLIALREENRQKVEAYINTLLTEQSI